MPAHIICSRSWIIQTLYVVRGKETYWSPFCPPSTKTLFWRVAPTVLSLGPQLNQDFRPEWNILTIRGRDSLTKVDYSFPAMMFPLFLKNIFQLHGMPVSQRLQLISHSWLLKVELHVLSTYYPGSNRQIKQDNCVFLLPLAEFAYKNSDRNSPQHGPFYGFHPCFHLILLIISLPPPQQS